MAKISDIQLSLFDIQEVKENKITELQQKTIDETIEKNTGCEVIISQSGIVKVIVDHEPKPIIPQGREKDKFTLNIKNKTYFIDKNGEVLAIAVGAVR